MILIANDAGSKELEPYFVSHRIETALLDLDYADFAFIGNGPIGDITVGVERKSFDDMLKCLRDNRLGGQGQQIDGLLSNYQCVYLVVEGMYRADPATGLLQIWRGGWQDAGVGKNRYTHAELQRYLINIATFTRVRVWQTHSNRVEDTVVFVADLYNQLVRKRFDEHKSLTAVHMPEIREPVLLRKRTPEEENELIRRMVAMCLPGIGQDVSKAVAAHFPSIRALATATEKEWMAVDGIGKGRAAGVTKVIGNL